MTVCRFATTASIVLCACLLTAATGCQRTSVPPVANATEVPPATPDSDASKESGAAPAAKDTPSPASDAATPKTNTDKVNQKPAGEDAPKNEGAEKKAKQQGGDDVPEHPFQRRSPAPSLDGGLAWINTAGPLDIKDLKGKFVLLDFWTYCCINCMHILPELKKLEHKYPNELVVIGVHSAKFDTEKDSQNIKDAVLRHEIEHPVVNDANHEIWGAYGVNSWPSLRVVDPEGNLVAGNSGEITFEQLDEFFKSVMPYYEKKGLMDKTPLKFDLEALQATQTPLRYPGKVLASAADGRLYISDSNHNRIVVADLDGKLIETIGSGAIGADDGGYDKATFDHPQGMALDGKTLYVADTENHLLRKIDLEKKVVATIAGTSVQNRSGWPGMAKLRKDPTAPLPKRWVGPPKNTAINSPWALWIHDGAIYIAMAGPHQIWKVTLDEKEIGPYAGNGREDIVDGPLLPPVPYEQGYSSFAQPSGLASDGTWLYVADSEGSSIRAVPFDPKQNVKTVVGTSKLFSGRLFTFGDRDGEGDEVLLQHALGVVFDQGKLYVADTYNNKIKLIDPEKRTSKTIAGSGEPGLADDPAQFDEPAGVTVAGGKLYVADTNNHAIRVVDLDDSYKVSTLTIQDLTPPEPPKPAKQRSGFPLAVPVDVKPQKVAVKDGKLTVRVQLKLPAGWKMNPLAPQRYQVELKGSDGPVSRKAVGKAVKLDKPAAAFEVSLPVGTNSGKETLKLSLQYYYCLDGAEGLCKTGSVRWTVPLSIDSASKVDAVEVSYDVK